MNTSDLEPPSQTLVNRRWVKPEVVEWALEADSHLQNAGSVQGTQIYGKQWQARNRARRLIEILVQLDIYERWELREHTHRAPKSKGEGYMWAVEFVGRGAGNGR